MSEITFKIEGEWLTQHCRSLWTREDKADIALRTLLDSLIGINYDQALGILDGRYRLVGDSNEGINMVPDTDRHDLPTLIDVLSKLKKERDEALDDLADLQQLHIGETVEIASPVGLCHIPRRRAHFNGKYNVLKDDCELDTLRDEYRLEGIGNDPTNKCIKYYKRDARWSFDEQKTKFASYHGDTKEYHEEEDDTEPPLEIHDSIISNTGWLSPDGKFYPCGHMEHNYIAYRLDKSQVDLERGGWVKLSNGDIFGFLWGGVVTPTEIQRCMLYDFCSLNKVKLPYFLRDSSCTDNESP